MISWIHHYLSYYWMGVLTLPVALTGIYFLLLVRKWFFELYLKWWVGTPIAQWWALTLVYSGVRYLNKKSAKFRTWDGQVWMTINVPAFRIKEPEGTDVFDES